MFVIYLYVLFTLVVFFVGLASIADAWTPKQRSRGALMVLTSWAWPVWAIYWVIVGLIKLVRIARTGE